VGNRALHEAIARHGLLLSEAEPGRRAFAGCFPRRNRIIAAIAKATIVVEAGHKSGAVSTATVAMGLDRGLAAVPGPIDVPSFDGCNQLICDGAGIVPSVEHALGLLGLSKNRTFPRPEMGPVEAEVWDALGKGDASVDELADLTGTAVRPLLEAVSNLEIIGLLAQRADGRVGRAAVL
jgi:DNA processing protein